MPQNDFNTRFEFVNTYSRGKGGSIGKKSLKFVEYNPTNRGELTDSDREKFTLKEFENIK